MNEEAEHAETTLDEHTWIRLNSKKQKDIGSS